MSRLSGWEIARRLLWLKQGEQGDEGGKQWQPLCIGCLKPQAFLQVTWEAFWQCLEKEQWEPVFHWKRPLWLPPWDLIQGQNLHEGHYKDMKIAHRRDSGGLDQEWREWTWWNSGCMFKVNQRVSATNWTWGVKVKEESRMDLELNTRSAGFAVIDWNRERVWEKT